MWLKGDLKVCRSTIHNAKLKPLTSQLMRHRDAVEHQNISTYSETNFGLLSSRISNLIRMASSHIASAFAGVDRGDPPPIEWMNELYNRSNFDFTGFYLSHSPSQTGTIWTRGDLFAKLESHGWGFVFFFVGFSVVDPGGMVSWPATVTRPDDIRNLGTQHGRSIKTIVAGLSPNCAGSVVIIDNEDAIPTFISDDTGTRTLIMYYDAMFTEMKTEGPGNLGAVRPGLYAHWRQQIPMLDHNPDLFVWLCDFLDEPADVNAPTPFTVAGNMIRLPLEQPSN
jgi:hypothetical protein